MYYSWNAAAREQETEHRRKEMENIKEPVAIRGSKSKTNEQNSEARKR